MYGYGQIDPSQFAVQACAAMGGKWDKAAMECDVGGSKYKLPDFAPPSLPTGACPDGQVQTPKGCFPYPGGVVNGNGVPPVIVNGGPPPEIVNGGPPPPAPPPAPAQAETPPWLVPAVIGIGAIALIALVK